MPQNEIKEIESPILVLGAGKYIVQMIGGLEPDITGPFESENKRDEQAKILHKEMDQDDNLFALDIDIKVVNGTLTLSPTGWCWSGGFFEESEG